MYYYISTVHRSERYVKANPEEMYTRGLSAFRKARHFRASAGKLASFGWILGAEHFRVTVADRARFEK